MLTHVSLFSGIGGIDLAAHAAGFETVAFCEIDPFARAVLRHYWPGVPIIPDVRRVTAGALQELGISSVDLLSGGFPCEPFSVAGKRGGVFDERHLWPEMRRVIREVRPRWVLAENVPGLLSIRTDDPVRRPWGIFGDVLRDLAEMGYDAVWSVYGAKDVGAPHKRDRVFIVAHSDGRRRQQCDTAKRRLPVADAQGSASMADPSGTGQQEQHPPAESTKPRHGTGNDDAIRRGGTAQSDMGRGTSRLSAGMDRCALRQQIESPRWPTGPQELQHDWEPPRVAAGVPNRSARLKALGKAVVPAQVYPILQAIADYENGLVRGG